MSEMATHFVDDQAELTKFVWGPEYSYDVLDIPERFMCALIRFLPTGYDLQINAAGRFLTKWFNWEQIILVLIKTIHLTFQKFYGHKIILNWSVDAVVPVVKACSVTTTDNLHSLSFFSNSWMS